MLQYASEIEVYEHRVSRFFPILANITFFLYIFFSFFGTAFPFREKVSEVSDIATSNVVNQIVFTILFITSIIALIPKMKLAVAIIYREKILFLFIMWGLLSILWSDYNFVSFKRWFQYFTGFTVALSMMVHVDFSEIMLKRIKYLFYLYVLISGGSILIIPGATDAYGIWRGIAPSKNHLGQSALISSLILIYSIMTESGIKRFISFFFLLLSLALLVGSQSMTSISTFIFLFFLSIVFYFDKYFRGQSIGRFITIISIVSFTAFSLIIIFFAPDILSSLAGSAGRDLTFTGRTDLWADVLRETEDHWVFGTGFQGFWVVENPELLSLYDIYVWLPNQAHNGYIDIFNEVGIIGLGLFILAILNYFFNVFKLGMPHYWKWFVISAVIVNLQETTFIRPQVVSGVMFMFSYVALFSDAVRKERFEREEEEELSEAEFDELR